MSVEERHTVGREVLRRATDRLLAWGFSPATIARQLGCSTSWVHAVQRERQLALADIEEEPASVEVIRDRPAS